MSAEPNLDIGLEYTGGINKPTPADVGKYARVALDNLGDPNLEYVVPTTIASGTGENASVDLLPASTPAGTLATGASVNFDYPIAAGKRYEITADVWVDDGAGGAVLFAKALYVLAHQTGGAAVKVLEAVIHDNAGAGFTFVATGSTTNIRFTLANTSGSTRSYNVAIGAFRLDKP